MKQLLFTKGPQGPIGATLGTSMNNFCSSSNKVSTHYITWLLSFWIWRRRCLKFAWFWPFGALPLGPHGGHTYYLNNFESPIPKDDSCQVWLKSNHAFSRRRWKCKKFTDDGRRTTDDGRRTTDDARRTTDDGRKRTAIAHSSLRLRWAKNDLLWFNRNFRLFDTINSCVFQIFLLRSIKAYLCPNIINFESMDFSDRRPEEVISFFWRSVYVSVWELGYLH